MSYTSPWVNPGQYVSNVNSLSSEGITIDKGVDRAAREANDFASRYSARFSLVTQLAATTAQFKENWTKGLQSSRDAASSLSGWLQRFDQVFLSMINDVETEGDAHDLVKEFQSFLQAGHPSQKYQLSSTPGPKSSFEEIEGLADKESNYVVESLQGNDWRNGLKKLKENLPAVQRGVQQVRGALNSYATKLE
ncbi:hypothetical protein EST38_g4410 [Candolleomyces aberdarensis]|uniref:Uncharacterized protein n=1 Tax=Candolleomyces aberdarensis TaxID=2316362 RepID=A0A4Q2DR22_9AGAR|nr:hypothetical protein EST38_g4410 [Candolleomyces aberdarensis]